jgi:lipopolysaccharide transport system ATP-binding protein
MKLLNAHLEPEILIVDEVLAVGDFDFQRKCLGKMKEVSGQGRTVLFVSHNLMAVKDLCTRAILIENGEQVMDSSTTEVIERYLKGDTDMSKTGRVPEEFVRNAGSLEAKFRSVTFINEKGEESTELFFREKFTIVFEFEAEIDLKDISVSVQFGSRDGSVFTSSDSFSNTNKGFDYKKGVSTVSMEVDTVILPGSYAVFVGLAYVPSGLTIDYIERILDFQVLSLSRTTEQHYKWTKSFGSLELDGKWKM